MSHIFYESEALTSLGFTLAFKKPVTVRWVSTAGQHCAGLDWKLQRVVIRPPFPVKLTVI